MNTSTSVVVLAGTPSKAATDAITPVAVKPRAAAIMLDVSISTLYELMSASELRSYKDGASRKILVDSIHEYVRRRVDGEPRPPLKPAA